MEDREKEEGERETARSRGAQRGEGEVEGSCTHTPCRLTIFSSPEFPADQRSLMPEGCGF